MQPQLGRLLEDSGFSCDLTLGLLVCIVLWIFMRTEGGGIPSREKHQPGQVQEQGHKPQGDKEKYLKLLASLGKLFIRTIFPFIKRLCYIRSPKVKQVFYVYLTI